MIKKGKHAKKRAFPFFSIILVLLSISVLSTGMIIGWSIYTKEQATYGYGFLIRTDDGYSYQFHYILPYDTIQDEIPVEAISILSTLEIQESSEYTD